MNKYCYYGWCPEKNKYLWIETDDEEMIWRMYTADIPIKNLRDIIEV